MLRHKDIIKKMMFKQLSVLFLILTCMNTYSQEAATIQNIDAITFKKMTEEKPGIILDTRTTAEFSRGHISGAQLINLQDPNIGNTLLALPKDKVLYLYCLSGSRSAHVARFLSQNGYTQIYNLQRGLMDWNAQRFALAMPETFQTEQLVDAVSAYEYNFLIKNETLVFIDFYAPWCAPCRQMMPMIDELKKEYEGKIKIVKINADASRELMQELGVRGVPLLQFFKNGEQVFSKYGMVQKAELVELFENSLK